jgi:hypothetical protein
MKKLVIILSFLSVALVSCRTIIGIKKVKQVSEDDVIELGARLSIPIEDTYMLDTSYSTYIRKTAGRDERKIKDHLQPLQAIYFGKENELIYPLSWQINCYVPGFPNLKWNYNGNMNQFPPASQAPLDSIFSAKKYLEFLRPVTGVVPFNTIDYDYIIIVFWNRFLEKQSKGLIEAVKRNAALADSVKVRLLYVNNDNLFVY